MNSTFFLGSADTQNKAQASSLFTNYECVCDNKSANSEHKLVFISKNRLQYLEYIEKNISSIIHGAVLISDSKDSLTKMNDNESLDKK